MQDKYTIPINTMFMLELDSKPIYVCCYSLTILTFLAYCLFFERRKMLWYICGLGHVTDTDVGKQGQS